MGSDSTDAYDFYPCLVDGVPASIYVNLRFEHDGPLPGADTRYSVSIAMQERGSHGIGTAEEGEALNACEEAIIARVAVAGLVYAGRVRSHGEWEMTFYGPDGRLEALRTAATSCAGARRVEVSGELDAAWRYYREVLMPDAERQQWMDDRRMVQILQEQGDMLVTPRPVDHHISFATEAARDAFIARVTRDGFTCDEETQPREPDPEHPFRAVVVRSDKIELDHIHDVVMTLVDAATEHGGHYDGWTAAIES